MSRYRYLNGIDWVVTGLDHSLRQTGGSGNWSQLVLELDGIPDIERFSAAAQRYAASFPVLQGRAVRGWQLVPVWKMPNRTKPVPLPFESRVLPEHTGFPEITKELGRCLTVPPGSPGRYIGFTLLTAGTKSWLAFRFDHRLLDARGAEFFLERLIRYVESGDETPPALYHAPEQKACLAPWIPKFKSGQHIVRLLHAQRHEAAPFELSARECSASGLRFTVIPLNEEHSDRLRNRAYEEAGYLMLSPWLASCVSGHLENLMSRSGRMLGGFMIPCSADLRTENNPELFFNHVGFICFSRPKGEPPQGGWARHFSRQFIEQVKNEIPRHFENAWKLSRILPAPLYGRLLRGPLKSFGGTLSMASVGDGLSVITSIGTSRVKNAFHMPMIPPAPGIGFFVNTFKNRLNICISLSASVLSDAEHEAFIDLLRNELAAPDRQ